MPELAFWGSLVVPFAFIPRGREVHGLLGEGSLNQILVTALTFSFFEESAHPVVSISSVIQYTKGGCRKIRINAVSLYTGLRPILLYCIGIAIQRIVGGIASRQQYEIRCEVLF